ncbi:amidohydrolase [Longispora albida]|uniref:amidohydrolase n=1 Tax=Longispora albida TaxID=203523 RepID=UPI000363FBDD|nr:amidohydrolase [Longispora albida]
MTSALSTLTSSWPETLPGADPLPGQLDRWLAAHGAELVATRRHIHAHPELSGEEFHTAELVAEKLRAAGLSPRLLPRGNGILCDIGEGDRVVGLRADLDALPLPDTKDVPYRSTREGVAHACGHDVHTTVVLGAGLALAQLAREGELGGRVRLIFQPSEEKQPQGAPEMIAFGALEDMSTVYALHCDPRLPVGLLGVRPGPITAAADILEVEIEGPGGHTSRPHLTVDLVNALSRVVTDVPALLNRRVDPRAGLVMVFGAIGAGEAANAIPNTGFARATVRVLNRDVWRTLPDLVTDLVHEVLAGTGAKASVKYTRGVPPAINDRMANAVLAGAASAALGADQVVETEISLGGEDFAFYLDQVPGALARLGVGVPGSGKITDLHQSGFDVDERAIGYGVRVLVHAALAATDLPAC